MPLRTLLRATRRLASARPEARVFAARAWLLAPLVRASLALVGFQRTLRWVEATPTGSSSRRRDRAPVGVDEGRDLVRGAFRVHVVGGQCLEQSLVQYLLHRRDGVLVRLVLGVKRPAEGLAAHAWVEAALESSSSASSAVDPSFVPLFVSQAEVPGA